ncbi:MAG: HAD family phosphatase [Eubacteriales bacterium]|nr:HAD family phosphatase [Eubacteriales bacterium]
MIKGIIFDMDGVLMDTEYFYIMRRQRYLDAMGFVRNEDHNFVGSNEKAIWEIMVPEDELLREELKLGYRAYRKLNKIPYRELLNPSMPDLFKKLNSMKLKIAIASSSELGEIKNMVSVAGVSEYVDSMLSGEDCRAHKPNPEIYLESLKRLKLSADEVLAVEDSPTGIMAAKNAKIRVLALKPTHFDLDQSNADVVIEKLENLLDYVIEQD